MTKRVMALAAPLCIALAMTAPPLVLAGCDGHETSREAHERREREAWESDDCADSATLLATTSGAPDSDTCTNKHHRMRVQVATHPSNEEAAALVFCECERETEPADDP